MEVFIISWIPCFLALVSQWQLIKLLLIVNVNINELNHATKLFLYFRQMHAMLIKFYTNMGFQMKILLSWCMVTFHTVMRKEPIVLKMKFMQTCDNKIFVTEEIQRSWSKLINLVSHVGSALWKMLWRLLSYDATFNFWKKKRKGKKF